MQSQKSRLILLAIVVLAVPAVAIYNAMNAPKAGGEHGGDEHKLEAKKTTEEEKAESSEQLRGALKKAPVAVIDDTKGSEGLAKKPTILIEKMVANRPAPNDAGTAIQWYNKDSRSAMKSEENSASRGD
ncbi:MAG: hypothetical protein KF733_03645 [Fimbriimonadaceae bacterium]|nr:MAG: hypothetical protein KF733_03645 [Fimbriimonadaceae bacterium]